MDPMHVHSKRFEDAAINLKTDPKVLLFPQNELITISY